MLNVERADDVDTVLEQKQHVLKTFGPGRTRRVGVGQLVHQGNLGDALQHGIHVQFGEFRSARSPGPGGRALQSVQQSQGIGAIVQFHIASHYVEALVQQAAGLLKHGVGFAHPGGVAQVYLKRSPALALQHVGEFLHGDPSVP